MTVDLCDSKCYFRTLNQKKFTFEQPSHLCSMPLFLPLFMLMGLELMTCCIEAGAEAGVEPTLVAAES